MRNYYIDYSSISVVRGSGGCRNFLTGQHKVVREERLAKIFYAKLMVGYRKLSAYMKLIRDR
jgi:hypothetical protein